MHKCLNYQYEIKYVISIYMIQYQCNNITKTNPKVKKRLLAKVNTEFIRQCSHDINTQFFNDNAIP